jgi:hypothetical protein
MGADTLISDFWPQEPCKNELQLFQGIKCFKNTDTRQTKTPAFREPQPRRKVIEYLPTTVKRLSSPWDSGWTGQGLSAEDPESSTRSSQGKEKHVNQACCSAWWKRPRQPADVRGWGLTVEDEQSLGI